jgi:hypothetical protein
MFPVPMPHIFASAKGPVHLEVFNGGLHDVHHFVVRSAYVVGELGSCTDD